MQVSSSCVQSLPTFSEYVVTIANLSISIASSTEKFDLQDMS